MSGRRRSRSTPRPSWMIDTVALYEAADMLYRGEAANALDAYDKAAERIGERDAQRRGVREGGEEVYPAGGEGAGPGVEKAIVAPGARAQGPRAPRRLPRQEVPEEDLTFSNHLAERPLRRRCKCRAAES